MMTTSTPSMPRLAALALALFGAAVLVGCGSTRTEVTVQGSTRITKGQELIDLQKAKAQGAVTEREFEELRQIILRRPN
ncbi:MAG: hypothetical protein ACK4S6_10005 [Roseateles asaccharophilus]|jgi:hypothetical protein|nr:hypothetical protein [Roseateles asaccharophilus]MDN3545121.1 hypothetical protein [Roseateles asaccharophilus]